MARQLDRHDGPARAPARHRVRLREARDADDELLGALDGEHARVRAPAEHERRVDLVRDEPQVVLAAQLAEARERLGGHAHAGRVVRGREHDRARALRDRGLDLGHVEPEVALGAQRHVHRRGARAGEDAGVGRVERLRDDDLVALAEDAQADREERRLRAREEDDAPPVDGPPGPGRDALGDRLEQRHVALRERVVRATGAHARDGGVDHDVRRVEVGVADRQHDDVVAAVRGVARPARGPSRRCVSSRSSRWASRREAHAPGR